MPTLSTYEYAYVRVVPHVERGEFVNVGVILFCRTRRFLATQTMLTGERLHMFAPNLDLPIVQAQLDLFTRICAGEGPIGQLGQAEAFHWLVAPHSTVIQCSPVHAGLCADPAATLAHLVGALMAG
ncbi:MAG: DUF3037 domain-containing protein [Chloroflexota bacterium]|nr:DUF3037 domain-containing protein [Chloroflexota bacterium]